jgi:hypothetical protein
MALPKVTPGTYNYGEYANPTPVRYRGGQEVIGQAIGQGLAMAGQIVGQKIEEKKKKAEQDKAILDKVIADTYSRSSKEARESNAEEVMKFSNQAGELAVMLNNKNLSKEERAIALKKYTAIQDGLEGLNTMQKLSESIDLENVSPSIIKNSQGFENYLLQKSIENNSAKRVWDENEGEWYIEYNGINRDKLDPSKVKDLNAIPDEAYETRRIPVSEIVSNPKNFFEIKTKIDLKDDPMVNLFQKAAKRFDSAEGDVYKTDIKNGYKYLNQESAVNGYMNSAEVDVIYNKIGKDIAEDVMGIDYTGDEEQQIEIKKLIANEVINYAEKQGVMAPVEKPVKMVDPVEERTDMDLRERAAAFRRIQGLKPGESMEIKYTGTNDFQKEDYIVGKSESGQVFFQRADGEPSEISQEDLIKEFGVGSLLVDQKAQQAGLKF